MKETFKTAPIFIHKSCIVLLMLLYFPDLEPDRISIFGQKKKTRIQHNSLLSGKDKPVELQGEQQQGCLIYGLNYSLGRPSACTEPDCPVYGYYPRVKTCISITDRLYSCLSC